MTRIKTLDEHMTEIATQVGHPIIEIDPHSMASFLVERGVYTEEEAFSEYGFNDIMMAMGLPNSY